MSLPKLFCLKSSCLLALEPKKAKRLSGVTAPVVFICDVDTLSDPPFHITHLIYSWRKTGDAFNVQKSVTLPFNVTGSGM